MTGALVVDTHAHTASFLPGWAAAAYHSVLRGRPRDVGLGELPAAGVSAVVVKAVGDPVVTRWYLRRTPWDAVQHQLVAVRDEAASAGAELVRTVGEIRAAAQGGRLAVLLGLEGADAVGTDLGLLAELARAGVRVIVPVHLGDNLIGSTCLPWQRYVGPVPVRRRSSGLTPFGVEFVKAMNDLGVVVDGSHADEETLLGMVEHSSGPVICSHAGARAVSSFERYLSDDALRAVASTGGLVGLWPYFTRGKGTPTLDALVDHARHVADLVGPEHLCLGTDMNGVPGLAEGFRGEEDVSLIAKHLLAGGFSDTEADGIMGENFLRVLGVVEGAAAT